MSETAFKVGDRVKVTEVDEAHFYLLGQELEIVEVVEPESDANVYFVRHAPGQILRDPFFADELTLVTSAPAGQTPEQRDAARLQRQLDAATAALSKAANMKRWFVTDEKVVEVLDRAQEMIRALQVICRDALAQIDAIGREQAT